MKPTYAKYFLLPYVFIFLEISIGWCEKFSPVRQGLFRCVFASLFKFRLFQIIKACFASPLPPSLCQLSFLHHCCPHDHHRCAYVHYHSCLCIHHLGTIQSCHHAILPSRKHLHVLIHVFKHAFGKN